MAFKFNPITGQLDLVGSGGSSSPDNFSYETVALGVVVTVPQYQQMIVDGPITVEGSLIVIGKVVLI